MRCSSTTTQQYFSLTINQPASQQYFSLITNQHQHQPPNSANSAGPPPMRIVRQQPLNQASYSVGMQRISEWSLRCLMHSRAAPFAFGSPRWNPPALRLRDYPFNLAAPDLTAKVLGGLCRVVKQMKFYGTTKGIDKLVSTGIHDSEATATDRLPDGIVHDRKFAGTDERVSEKQIWEGSTHRDGAIYKKNWGFYGSGRPINLADRRETDLESYMSSKVSPCYPYPGNCTRHPPDEMIQVCLMRLARTPMNSDSIQLYGYLAARDFLDGRLNYVFNRSRDNPLTVQKGKLIEMTGPTRGIVIFAEVLMEFDMRIKSGEKEEDDLQLIDGVAFFSNSGYVTSVTSYTLRFSGCHGGAVDMRFAHIEYGMEAVIEVDTPEVNSAFNLSLVSALEEYGEIELFNGDIAELGTKRFVVAVPDDTIMYLEFKVGKEGSEADHYCKIDTSQHGCVSRQEVVLEMACILVKVSILSPDPVPYP